MDDYVDERTLLTTRIQAAVRIVTEFGLLEDLLEAAQEVLIRQFNGADDNG